MAGRTVKLTTVLVVLIVLAAVSGCYIPSGPWEVVQLPVFKKMEMKPLGPVHIWVPEWVLYIDETCTLVDESGSAVTNLAVIRGGKVTIWNKSGAIAYVDFGDGFAPPGDVRLNPEYGVWRRVAMEASTSGFEVTVKCEEAGEYTMTPYALPDTIITPP